MQRSYRNWIRIRFPNIGHAARICHENKEQASSNLRWHNLGLGVDGCRSLATDPEYDSMAPAISIAAGWLPGGIYASLCVLVAFVCSHALVSFKTRKNREQSDGHQSTDQPR